LQRLQLAAYDEAGSGMLDVQQLQRYLAAAVASAPLLACIEVRPLPLPLLLVLYQRHARIGLSLRSAKECVQGDHCCLPRGVYLWLRLQASFLPNYLQITSRKLLLFHGRHSRQQRRLPGGSSSSGSGTGLVVRLSELVNSPVMAELQEMLSLGPGADQARDLFNNWFSLQVGGRQGLCSGGR
jgi:hypothetical protein